MTEPKLQARPVKSARLLWFIGLYCLGSMSVALVAYGVRFWVGG